MKATIKGESILPDPKKLEILADWFDNVYPGLRKYDGSTLPLTSDEVQQDLRRWASDIKTVDCCILKKT